MRLAIYSDHAYRRDGDTYYHQRPFGLFAAGLADHVTEVVMVGRVDPDPGTTPYPVRDDVSVTALPHYPKLSDLSRVAVATLRSLAGVWRTLRRVDAVWAFGPHPVAIACALFGALQGKRVILGVRQDYPQYARSRHPGRPLLQLTAVALELVYRVLALAFPVVVVGPDLARRYRHARALLPVVVSLVPEDDVVAEDSPPRVWNGEIRLLSVGRVDAEKNPLMLADVLARLRERDPRWRLVVCGDGPLLPALRDRLHELGIAPYADLRGHVPVNDGLLDVYRHSDVFVHVSWTEGVPGVLLEAFAAGLPVVATAVGGVAAMAGDSAVLVPPGDSEAACEALARIADDAPLRNRLRVSAIACARQHTQEAESRRVARFLAEVA